MPVVFRPRPPKVLARETNKAVTHVRTLHQTTDHHSVGDGGNSSFWLDWISSTSCQRSPKCRLSHHSGYREPAGRKSGDDGLVGCDSPGTPVLYDRGSQLGQLDEHAWQHPDNFTV